MSGQLNAKIWLTPSQAFMTAQLRQQTLAQVYLVAATGQCVLACIQSGVQRVVLQQPSTTNAIHCRLWPKCVLSFNAASVMHFQVVKRLGDSDSMQKRLMPETLPAMIPAIWLTALLCAGLAAALLGSAVAPSGEGPAAGLGALLAKDGSCLASRHLTALHL